MNPKIESETPISIYELKREISKIKKRDTELKIRTGKTEDYISQVSSLSLKDIDKLEKSILNLEIPRLKEKHVKKIVDIFPKSEDELKCILSGYAFSIKKENLSKIAKIVKEYVKD